MKGAIVLATILAVVALGACRKEVEHELMKLGASSVATQQVAR